MNDKILFVDDEPKVLRSYQRFIGLNFKIDTAIGAESGLKMLEEKGPYAVVVSDMRMPRMNGAQFLEQVRLKYPRSVRVLLTGQADMNDAIDVVNKGQIFRFLTKPCPPEIFGQALKDSLEQHRLIIAEKILLQKTLIQSIKLLTDIISIINPQLFSRSTRVRAIASTISKSMQLNHQWKVEIAALLSQLGCITAPKELLEKKNNGQDLTRQENEEYVKHLVTGRKFLSNIPRLEEVAEAIEFQEKHYDGGGFPDTDLVGEKIPLISRILKVASDFDNILTKDSEEKEAIEQMKNNVLIYDPEVLAALEHSISGEKKSGRVLEITVDELQTGMVLAENLKTKNHLLLVAKNQPVSETMKICISKFASAGNIEEPIRILVSNG